MIKQSRFQVLLSGLMFLCLNLCWAQPSSDISLDSLLNKDFRYLEDKIFEQPRDTVSANIYTQLYLKKARKTGDYRKEIDGFYLLSIINDRKKSLSYSDSAIFYSKKYQINDWLASIYLNKGNLYYTNDQYEDATENYLLARKSTDPKVQVELYQMIISNIAQTKRTIGKDKEALSLYKEILRTQSLNTNPDLSEIDTHLDLLFGLADSYKKNDKLDSATIYNRVGTIKSKKYRRELYYSRFLLNEATNLFQKKSTKVHLIVPILLSLFLRNSTIP